jgi:Tfp pilus assembly protein PilN
MTDTSFLPEDYLARKAERRTSLICLVLFVVVMAAVVGAFFVTNQQWTQVKAEQDRINSEYQSVALKIQQLNELETQRESMLQKAELAAALVERVPRSIMLAELINRMPQRLSLLEFSLDSQKVATTRQVTRPETGRLSKGGPKRGVTKSEAMEEGRKVEPPRYEIKISMVGVAPTDLEVSEFMSSLNGYELLRDVTLEYSEESMINERVMRQFRISMELDGSADARDIEPLIRERGIKNPMRENLEILSGVRDGGEG